MFLLSAALLMGMQTADDAPVTMLAIPPGRCRVVVDGRPMSLRQFRVVAKGWKRTQPMISLQPDPQASYRCVDRVLKIVTTERLTKLGFIGYEQNRAEDLPPSGSTR